MSILKPGGTIAAIFMLLIFVFAGCTRRGNSIPKTTCSFDADGKRYTWNGTLAEDSVGTTIIQVIAFGQTEKFVLFTRPDSTGFYNRATMDITRDSMLDIKLYRYKSNPFYTSLNTHFRMGTANPFDVHDYVNGLDGDSVNLQITSIHDTIISGTFSAVLTTVGNISQKMKINGSFENARVIKVFR